MSGVTAGTRNAEEGFARQLPVATEREGPVTGLRTIPATGLRTIVIQIQARRLRGYLGALRSLFEPPTCAACSIVADLCNDLDSGHDRVLDRDIQQRSIVFVRLARDLIRRPISIVCLARALLCRRPPIEVEQERD